MITLDPRYYQRQSVDEIFKYFDTEIGNPLIVLPTGSGKSLVQALIADKVIHEYDGARILFLTHQQELIQQNNDELVGNFESDIFDTVDAGIYSAGLGRRDTQNKIIFAGIQSIYKKITAWQLGKFNLIVVDECHLIPHKGNGMYRQYFEHAKEIYSHVKIIGMSATPYRLDTGLLTTGDGALFDRIIYSVSVKELIDKGFLCSLISKNGSTDGRISRDIKKTGKEFNGEAMAAACDQSVIIEKAVEDFKARAEDRRHILIFCAGIQHAEHVSDECNRQGIQCAVVHSKMPDHDKERNIKDFRDGKIRAIANCDILTTGFNAKHIDCIIMLRPTMSAGLYYQMCGRGLRVHPGKENCLVLDYAGNISTHGPIDCITVQDKGLKESQGVETAPVKECPGCMSLVPIQTRECPDCGYLFPTATPHGYEAEDGDIISRPKPPEEREVHQVIFSVHEKRGDPGNFSLKIMYYHTDVWYTPEWKKPGSYYWNRYWEEVLPIGYPTPDTIDEALELNTIIRIPESIMVQPARTKTDFDRIISRIYPTPKEQPVQVENRWVR
jgi:DNA repair protein RadD